MNRTLGKLLFALALCALAFTPGLITPVEAGLPVVQADQAEVPCVEEFFACQEKCDRCILEFACGVCVCCS